jgi:hypothetical protein
MAATGYTPILIYSSTTASQAPLAANLTNSTLGSELAINITDGKLFYKDNGNSVQVIGWKVVPTTAGGTGLTTYAGGDMLYYTSGTVLSKLAIGTTGYYISSSGSAPQWSAPAALTKTDDTNVTLTLGGSASTALLNAASLTLGWSGQLATGRGGTGLSTYTAGDLVYYATGTALSKLAIGASTTILTSSGSAPQWSAASGVTIGTATNLAGGAAGSVPYQTGAGATSMLAIGTAYQMLGVNAGGTAPSWQASSTSTLTTQGDLLYASAANTLARLAKNTTATRYLSNTGTSNNPAWAQIDLTNGVTGTLPIANGGTNGTSFTAKSGNVAGLVYYDGTKLANNATVTNIGYNTSSNTLNALNLAVATNLDTYNFRQYSYTNGTTGITLPDASYAAVSQNAALVGTATSTSYLIAKFTQNQTFRNSSFWFQAFQTGDAGGLRGYVRAEGAVGQSSAGSTSTTWGYETYNPSSQLSVSVYKDSTNGIVEIWLNIGTFGSGTAFVDFTYMTADSAATVTWYGMANPNPSATGKTLVAASFTTL